MSRIEAGRTDLHIARMSARSLVVDMSVIEPLARRNNNRFIVHAGDCDYLADLDPMRFRQSLLNLLGNACKFTENGAVPLTLDQRLEDEKPWVC